VFQVLFELQTQTETQQIQLPGLALPVQSDPEVLVTCCYGRNLSQSVCYNNPQLFSYPNQAILIPTPKPDTS